MYCPKEISSARYYEPQGYKEFYTEETDGINFHYSFLGWILQVYPKLISPHQSIITLPVPMNFLAPGMQIISRLVAVKLSGQTYFCLDINYPIFGRTNIDNNNTEPSNIQLKFDTLNFVLTSVNHRTNCPAIYRFGRSKPVFFYRTLSIDGGHYLPPWALDRQTMWTEAS